MEVKGVKRPPREPRKIEFKAQSRWERKEEKGRGRYLFRKKGNGGAASREIGSCKGKKRREEHRERG